MKNILAIMILIINFANANLNDKMNSPTFDYLMEKIIPQEKYIFDDKVIVQVPDFADNPSQVPVLVNGEAIQNAKRMILFADLNPIPEIIDINLVNMKAFISLNIKLEQSTPIRALVQDDKNLWHIGSAIMKGFGGGCSASSLEKGNTAESLIGTSKSKITYIDGITRIRWKVYHPMIVSLFTGGNEFFLNSIQIKNDNDIIGNFKLHSSISQNPSFIIKPTLHNKKYNIKIKDSDANEYFIKAKL